MTQTSSSLDEEIFHLYQEPAIGSGYSNMYGEENILGLVNKYRGLNPADQARMRDLVISFSESVDLASSFVSVAVLHALGMDDAVKKAYLLVEGRDEAESFHRHFDIGISLADYFVQD